MKHKKEIGISPIGEKDELTDQRERENRELLLLSQMRNDKLEMLAKVGRGDFKREQESNSSLKEVCKKAKLRKLRYEIRSLLVERKTRDNHGNERIQLVVPQNYRENI